MNEFEWKILTLEEATKLWDKVEVYKLYDDDTEALVESLDDLEDHIKNGCDVAIEATNTNKSRGRL